MSLYIYIYKCIYYNLNIKLSFIHYGLKFMFNFYLYDG